MVKRVYDYDKVGYVEYNDSGKVERVKVFYGHPQYYRDVSVDPKTGQRVETAFENAIYSWRSEYK